MRPAWTCFRPHKLALFGALIALCLYGRSVYIVPVVHAEDAPPAADAPSGEKQDKPAAEPEKKEEEAKKEESGKDKEKSVSSADEEGDQSSEGDKKKKKKKKKKAKESETPELVPTNVDQAPAATATLFSQFVDNPEMMREGGIDAILLLDSSGSMQREEREKIREHGAKIFVRLLGENDRVTVLQFDRIVKRLLDFTEIRPGNLPRIDRAIERVSSDGTHTDLEAPIRAAIDILKKKARKNSTGCIILVSDGTMDPHPSRGTKESLTEQLINVDLPLLRRNAYRLFTVSIGTEADQTYLENIATLANGNHYHAGSLPEVHENLSDIVLAIRNPVVSKTGGAEFEVSSEMEEVTFYIDRAKGEDNVSLLGPNGAEITSAAFPANVKWFRGGNFDIVSVSKPLIGTWTVSGVSDAEHKIAFYTDFKIDVNWVHPAIMIGDQLPAKIKLLGNGEPIVQDGFKRVIFLRYSIYSGKTGQLDRRGTLRQEVSDGNNTVDANTFSTIIEGTEAGPYRAIISLVAPTFTRTADFSYNVLDSPFLLSAEKGSAEPHTPSKLTVRFGKKIADFKSFTMKLKATNKETEKERKIKVPELQPNQKSFEISEDVLPAGEYTVEAYFEGKDLAGKPVQINPQSLTFFSFNPNKEVVASEGEEEHSALWPILGAVGSVLICLGGMGFVGFIVRKKFILTLETPVEETPYEVPEALQQELAAIKEKASSTRRTQNDAEAKIFAVLLEPATSGSGAGRNSGTQKTASETDTDARAAA